MAYEYSKVLDSFKVCYTIIGRGKSKANELSNKINKKVYIGGVENFFNKNDNSYKSAIIASGVIDLTNIAKVLIKNSIKSILIEKPGGMNLEDISSLAQWAKKENANIYVAYNRRFYSTTFKAKEIIKKDGGLTSFKFDFTEWSSVVTKFYQNKNILNNWFLINSSHVIDLAFFIGGDPIKIESNIISDLPWHPSGSIFTGSGVTNMEIPFSYHANWNAPGRWSIEFFTKNHRIILCPLEELKIQNNRNLKIRKVRIDCKYDKQYKPGLFMQISSFLNDKKNLIKIENHASSMWYYAKINGNN